jgi:hypothetical protein
MYKVTWSATKKKWSHSFYTVPHSFIHTNYNIALTVTPRSLNKCLVVGQVIFVLSPSLLREILVTLSKHTNTFSIPSFYMPSYQRSAFWAQQTACPWTYALERKVNPVLSTRTANWSAELSDVSWKKWRCAVTETKELELFVHGNCVSRKLGWVPINIRNPFAVTEHDLGIL